jgi:hypothetical protein
VWHPVGQLPAAVYWRRRLLVLTLLLVLLGGGVWLGFWLLAGRAEDGTTSSDAASSVATPGLERVVPSLSAVTTPTPPSAPAEAAPAAEAPAAPPPAVPAPVAGGPCADDMIAVEVRTPGTAAVGSKPIFELAVANVSPVPCVRAFDKGLQEFLLLDLAGARLWGSNDCFPEAGPDRRTLAPGATVGFPLVWGGLTSEPTCTAPRTPPSPGAYAFRGRLDTKVSTDTPVVLR